MTVLCTYQESTSDASDASSVAAASGSPPRSRNAHSDEDDRQILSWSEDVANSDSDSPDAVRLLALLNAESLFITFVCPFRDSLRFQGVSALGGELNLTNVAVTISVMVMEGSKKASR